MSDRHVDDSHIRFEDGVLILLDQRVLPGVRRDVRCTNSAEVADAIRTMVVRGAPAIGITAAYGMALARMGGEDMETAQQRLLASRPTAVNLRWAVERLSDVPADRILEAAKAIHDADIEANLALGDHGASLLPANATLFTHCNAGALATGGWGTALGVVRSARHTGGVQMVYAGETRPWLQGARLTAYELDRDGIPCTLIADTAAGAILSSGEVDAVVVGADRVAANGDVANKIGTLNLAVLCKHYGVPFYVAVPTSTLDARCPSGAEIPIEERDASEVRGHGGAVWAADVTIRNPAFDVTPAALVTAWITEEGLWSPDGADRGSEVS